MGFEKFGEELGKQLLGYGIDVAREAGGKALGKGSGETCQGVLTVNGKTIPYTLTFNEKRHELKGLIEINNWDITVDWYRSVFSAAAPVFSATTPIVYTRIRAPFVNTSGLRFTIYSKIGLLDYFKEVHEGSMLPLQDIQIGDAPFDERFVVQGNNEDSIRELIASPKIRRLIQSQEHLYLQVKDDEGWFSTRFPEGVDELYFQVGGIIGENDERLGSLVELFITTLNRLCRLGLASKKDPRIIL
jgi:hypothetical protein